VIDNDLLTQLIDQQRRMTATILTLATVYSRVHAKNIASDHVPSLFDSWLANLMKADVESLESQQ
jgi:hypothetical protein